MPMASFTDANSHLDASKIAFADDNDALDEATSADRYIRSFLYDAFGTAVDDWVDPEDTPEIIREAASLLMAAQLYAKRYSENTVEVTGYAEFLNNKANLILQGVKDGSIELSDSPGIVSGLAWSNASFWPNDTTVVEGTTDPLRAFSMDLEF